MELYTVKTLIRAAALIKFQVTLSGSYLRAATNQGRLLSNTNLG